MPKAVVIEAGHKDGPKDSRSVDFSTFSEAMAALKAGKAPAPWSDAKQFFMDAVAHRTVEIQNDIRRALAGGKPGTGRKHLLDE